MFIHLIALQDLLTSIKERDVDFFLEVEGRDFMTLRSVLLSELITMDVI